MTMETSVSRRSFVGATAAVAGAVLAGGLVANANAEEAAGWDAEADIVVVGGGLGVWGALRAATGGASVILLEKQHWGGSAGLSEGTFWLPTHPFDNLRPEGYEDTPEEAAEYMRNIIEGSPMERAQAFLDACPEFCEWSTSELGVEWKKNITPCSAYYDVPGAKADGRALQFADSITGIVDDDYAPRGPMTWDFLRTKCDELGVQVMMDTPARHVVTNGDGDAIGVIAEDADGNELRIRAKKGVLLAAGGFDHNEAMRKAYFHSPVYMTHINVGATGDGVLMGQEVGAGVELMSQHMTCQYFLPTWDESKKFNPDFEENSTHAAVEWRAFNGYQGYPGALLVNKYGKRFCNEAAAYGTFPRAWDSYDAGTYEFCPNIPAYFISDSKQALTYGLPTDEWMTTADTLEELLEKLGLPVDETMETINRFNENAAQGVDPDFNRGGHDCERLWGDFLGIMGDALGVDIPDPNLAPVDMPPFYGCVMVPGTNGCNGGLKVDEHTQVLTMEGTPIGHLYSAGTNAVHVGGPSYAAGGVSIGSGSVMSFVAAKEILALEDSVE